MFVNVVTIEKDPDKDTLIQEKETYAMYKTRVSYRTRDSFSCIEKDGTPGKTYVQFIDATMFIRKSKDGKLPFEAKDLTKGVMMYVEGEIGINIVAKKGSDKERMYFPQITISSARILGMRPAKADTKADTQEPMVASAATPSRLQPRTPADDGDKYSDFLDE